MKPHIKVIQRNGVDVFVTSSMEDKLTVSERLALKRPQWDCTVDYGDSDPDFKGINNDPGVILARQELARGIEQAAKLSQGACVGMARW